MKDINNGTVSGALTFLRTLVDKGILSNGQAKPLIIAITKVFSAVDGTTWEQTNVRGTDIDDYMRRFVNKTDVFYTKDSLQTYRSRVARALGWYEHFLDDPGWTPQVNTQKGKPKKQTITKERSSSQNGTSPDAQEGIDAKQTQGQSLPLTRDAELVTYPFPLENGQTAKLSLPFYLKKDEAKRLAAFLDSIAMPERDTGTTHEN